MKWNLNRLSLSRYRREGGRKRMGRQQRIARCGSPMLWHTRWAERIIGRFARRMSRAAMHPEAMIMAFAARPSSYILQRFLFNTWVTGGNGALSAGQGSAFRTSGDQPQARGVHEPQSVVRNFFSTQFRREIARDAQSVRGQSSQAMFPISGALGGGKMRKQSGGEGTALWRARMSQRDFPGVLPLAGYLTHRTALVAPTVQRSEAEIGGVYELVANATQKHRRIEELRLAAGRDPVPTLALPAMSESVATVERRQIQSRRPHKSKFESEPRHAQARPDFAFDAARVTDEILKQLDRRVIAARERMGRT